MAQKLTKITPPERYFHIFKRQDGTTFEVETTQADYQQLGQLNPTNPTNAGGTWSHSVSKFVIGVGEYMDEGGKQRVVNLDGFICPLKNEFMNGSNITDAGILEVARIKAEVQSLKGN